MVVLVGFMGAGKSTIGRLLAARLGLPFVDTDALIEGRTGMTVADIFATKGEAGFREIERDVAFEVLDGRNAVVSLGGGAVVDPALCSEIKRHDTLWLDVSLGEALRRVGDAATRPMLGQRDPSALLAERARLYESVAAARVDTTGRDPNDIVDELTERFSIVPSDDFTDRRIRVELDERAYDVVVGDGVAAELSRLLPASVSSAAEKAFVLTHPELVELAEPVVRSLDGMGLETTILHVPSGETSKSLATVSELLAALAERRAHRHDVVVAVGGGVVTDVGGFVASTYVRGMPLVHVPTTLLGQVDAAIGGKTGVNLPHGKNLVGTIYQPAAVVCDVSLLKTCPVDEIRSGLAEVVKYGFVADPSLLDRVVEARDAIVALEPSVLIEIVARCAAIKASVVASDERETGERAWLNYGHTFAHAIESLRGYGSIKHGEAVSIGMVAAALTAAEIGRLDEAAVDLHRRVLAGVGLPVTARLDLAVLEAAWMHDKKYDKGVRFVLLAEVGRPEAGVEVPRDALARALERLAREDGEP